MNCCQLKTTLILFQAMSETRQTDWESDALTWSATMAKLSSGQFNQDYTGIAIPFTISGYVRDLGNKGLNSVRLNFSNYAGSIETDSSGFYNHTVYYGWTGTATPEKSGYTFSPASLSYTGTSSNHTVQNYTGNPTAVPDIAVSPSSLIFTRPKTRSAKSGADSSASIRPGNIVQERTCLSPKTGAFMTRQ